MEKPNSNVQSSSACLPLSQALKHDDGVNQVHWSWEENKQFERALAELDHNSADFFAKICMMVPTKSIEEIRMHYEALVQDLEMIESDQIPLPSYELFEEGKMKKEVMLMSSSSSDNGGRKPLEWTEEECRLFEEGMEKHGERWKLISENYVQTKTPHQASEYGRNYLKLHENDDESKIKPASEEEEEDYIDLDNFPGIYD